MQYANIDSLANFVYMNLDANMRNSMNPTYTNNYLIDHHSTKSSHKQHK